MSLLAPLLILAQIGPAPGGAMGSRPPAGLDRPAASRTVTRRPAPPLPVPLTEKGRACNEALAGSLTQAGDFADGWAASAKGEEVAEAQACRGMVASKLENWAAAETAFIAAREAAGTGRLARVRYGAMAGNAALAGGGAENALAALNTAQVDAAGLGDDGLLGEIAIDKARALVALNRAREARLALDEAMAKVPGNSDAWLLSAALYRRGGDLGKAQKHIERAAEIDPTDPSIGLEAGKIAMLAGREAAARRSWTSVISISPQSLEAAEAKGYIDQLPPAPVVPR